MISFQVGSWNDTHGLDMLFSRKGHDLYPRGANSTYIVTTLLVSCRHCTEQALHNHDHTLRSTSLNTRNVVLAVLALLSSNLEEALYYVTQSMKRYQVLIHRFVSLKIVGGQFLSNFLFPIVMTYLYSVYLHVLYMLVSF